MENKQTEPEFGTEEYWNNEVQVLVGKTIVKAEYMSDDQMEDFGWDDKGLQITFKDGSMMLLSADDEGNGPGSAFTNIPELDTIPKI